MEFDQTREIYLNECYELLEEMESSLLLLESEPGNEDLLNAIFRAAHTIKGTSGLFGFDDVVEFTHKVESFLDKMRSSEVEFTQKVVALLLSCRDHMRTLVELAVSSNPTMDEETRQLGVDLSNQLLVIEGKDTAGAFDADATNEITSNEEVFSACWHISLRFSQNVLRDGMDPLSFIGYLSRMGELVNVSVITDALPKLEAYDPEACYLGFEIDFKGDASKEEIEAVFEFIREESEVHILPPKASISHYAEVIEALPEDNLKLGEILVASGALTANELGAALKYQWESQSDKDSVSKPPPIGEVLVDQHVVHRETVNDAIKKQNSASERKLASIRTIRVDAEKLGAQINLVGELVIAGARANLLAQQFGNETLIESISMIGRLVEEIRDSALRLRMVQIGETFSRFHRVVRDVSSELGKEIKLNITGAETELDKTLVEKIGDPLMHLIRNAMDHGLETPEERQSSGKPVQGELSLNAFHDSGSIVIEVRDDGRGLNKEKILNKAIERGLINHGQGLADHEVFQMIFEPGFSTADKVSNLSGRGVGMDVVKKNITSLRGTVDMKSIAGQGTTVSIRLPLTLAIIDGFLLGVGTSSYVIPLDSVVECIELTESSYKEIEDKNYINLRGEVLPFIRIKELFSDHGKVCDRESIVVVQFGDMKAGLVVDELKGEFQTVIKPLGKLFEGLEGVSGSTILGSGEVAVILDVPGMISLATRHAMGNVKAGNGFQALAAVG